MERKRFMDSGTMAEDSITVNVTFRSKRGASLGAKRKEGGTADLHRLFSKMAGQTQDKVEAPPRGHRQGAMGSHEGTKPRRETGIFVLLVGVSSKFLLRPFSATNQEG